MFSRKFFEYHMRVFFIFVIIFIISKKYKPFTRKILYGIKYDFIKDDSINNIQILMNFSINVRSETNISILIHSLYRKPNSSFGKR